MKEIIKNDYTNAIFPIANRGWLRYIGIYVLLGAIPLILLAWGFIALMGGGFIEEFRALQGYQDFEAQEQHINALIREYFFNPTAVTYLIASAIIYILLSTWMLFGFFELNKYIIEEERATIPGVLSAITLSGFGKLLGLQLIIWIGTILYFICCAFLADISILFLLLGFLAYFFFLLKLILTVPKIVYEKSGIREAVRYSWKNMTTKTTFGFYLGIIVLFVTFFIVTFILRALLMMIGGVEVQFIISQILQLGLSTYMYALLVGAISSYYYSLQSLPSSKPREQIEQYD